MLIAFLGHPVPLRETTPASVLFLIKTAEFAGP